MHERCAESAAKCKEVLEAMQLHGVLGDTLLDQEGLNLEPLVTLELDNLAGLLIFDEGTIASEFLSDRTRSALGQTRTSATSVLGTGGCRQGERTFLKALRSFLESYSRRRRTTTIRLLTKGGMVLSVLTLGETLQGG
jgi:hypothetical protein